MIFSADMMNVKSLKNYELVKQSPQLMKSQRGLPTMSNKEAPSFRGHLGSCDFKNGMKMLVYETAFFRDMQTKLFVKNQIMKNFSNKKNIKMIIGGCSTGEEVYTYSMLLNEIKDKIKILGLDLSHETIALAKSKKVLFQSTDSTSRLFTKHCCAFNDTFLAFDEPKKVLTPEQIEQKKLFDEFFEPCSEIPAQECESFKIRLQRFYIEKILREKYPVFENKYVKLKDNKAKNCEFMRGDINKIKNITDGKKVDVITFSNAFYHLISQSNFGKRELKSSAGRIAKNFAIKIKENLTKKGLFVLGENEINQTQDDFGLVETIFKSTGLKPLNATVHHPANVWQNA